MNTTLSRSIFAVLALFSLLATPASATTFTMAQAARPNLAGGGSWTSYGSPSILGDGRISLRESGLEKSYVWKDVSVAGRGGDTALFIAYTKAQRVDTRGTRTASDITGMPYLYGYAMNGQDRILAYFQGQNMRHDAGNENVWDVSSGTFTLPNDTVKVRLFLKQAERRGTTKGDFEAWFYDPGVYVFDRSSDAQVAIDGYRAAASRIPTSSMTPTTPVIPPAPTNPPSGSDACSPSGTLLLRTTFEQGLPIDTRFRFGALTPTWTYTVHDYVSGTSVSASIGGEAGYDGSSALRLLNPSYGFDNGRERTAPVVSDEAVGYDVTNLFAEGEKYRVSMRVRVAAPAGAGAVPVAISKETRQVRSSGEISQSYQTAVGNDWKCVYLDVRQGSRSYYSNVLQPVAEDVVLFFGGLPKDAKIYIDDARVTKL